MFLHKTDLENSCINKVNKKTISILKKKLRNSKYICDRARYSKHYCDYNIVCFRPRYMQVTSIDLYKRLVKHSTHKAGYNA